MQRIGNRTVAIYSVRIGEVRLQMTETVLIAASDKSSHYVWSAHADNPAYKGFEKCDYQRLILLAGTMLGNQGMEIAEAIDNHSP